MPEFIQKYNLNSLYVCLILLIYNILKSNYDYITIILSKLYLFNYTSLFLIINIIGLVFFLKNLSFEVDIKWSIKYK
jgi:hypothetical protein